MELLQQQPGERHGEQSDSRQAGQQDAQRDADGLADAHECRREDGQNHQVMQDGGGGPGGDPDVRGAHALQEFLAGIEPGKDALRVAGGGLRARGQRQHRDGERERGGRMVEEGAGRGYSSRKVTAMGRQADGADQQRDGEGARRGFVFEGEDCRARNQRAERTDGSHQQRGGEGEPQRFGHQEEAPYAERAGGDLLGGEYFAEAGAGDGAEGESSFVVESKGDVGVLHQDVVTQDGGVAQMFKDGDVDLAILLQPGVAGELKISEQRERQSGGSGRPGLHFAGVLSSCCFTQTRLGLSASDLVRAWRAGAS